MKKNILEDNQDVGEKKPALEKNIEDLTAENERLKRKIEELENFIFMLGKELNKEL